MAKPAAAATVVDSSAYAISSSLKLLNLAEVKVGPIAATGGTAAPAYSTQANLASVNQTLTVANVGVLRLNEGLTAGVVKSTASSAFPATTSGTARSEIADLGARLFIQPLIGPATTILNLGVDVIDSQSTVSAVNGVLTAVGTSKITGLDLTALGLGNVFDAQAFLNADPNTVLLNVLGLKVTLNEQTLTGNGTSDLGLSTNALRLSFNNFGSTLGVLNGDLILGHSQASISGYVAPVPPAVPEPASWAMMIAGFGLIGGAMRARRPMERMAHA